MGAPPLLLRQKDGRQLVPYALVIVMACMAFYLSSSHTVVGTSFANLAARSIILQHTLPDVTSPAAVYGNVTKHGPLGVVSQLAAGQKWNDLLFPPDWVKQRLAGEKPEPPSKYCNPMFNDKYKLIYIKCPKNGGTTVMDGYFSHCNQPRHHDRCLHMADYTNTTEVAHLNKIWGDYFTFGFSRNVFTRAISQFQYLSTFIKNDTKCPKLEWTEYCQDPYLIGDVCTQTDSRGESCCTIVPEHNWLHAIPQSNCMTTRDGQLAVDWLGRVEHFYDDFAELISILNARPGLPQLPKGLPSRLNTNFKGCNKTVTSGPKGAQGCKDPMEWFTGDHAHCLDGISRFYAEDVQLLSAPVASSR